MSLNSERNVPTHYLLVTAPAPSDNMGKEWAYWEKSTKSQGLKSINKVNNTVFFLNQCHLSRERNVPTILFEPHIGTFSMQFIPAKSSNKT